MWLNDQPSIISNRLVDDFCGRGVALKDGGFLESDQFFVGLIPHHVKFLDAKKTLSRRKKRVLLKKSTQSGMWGDKSNGL